MLNYAETASSRTTVSLPVPCAENEQGTSSPSHACDLHSPFQHVGPFERLSIIGVDLLCDPIFTQGYRSGYHHATQAGGSVLLTDQHMTTLINEHCPPTLAPCHLPDWRRAFVLGWMACWFERHLQTAKARPTLSALLEHAEFQEGLVCAQEEFLHDYEAMPLTEDEMIDEGEKNIGRSVFQRSQKICHVMNLEPPSYLYNLGFVIGTIDQGLTYVQ